MQIREEEASRVLREVQVLISTCPSILDQEDDDILEEIYVGKSKFVINAARHIYESCREPSEPMLIEIGSAGLDTLIQRLEQAKKCTGMVAMSNMAEIDQSKRAAHLHQQLNDILVEFRELHEDIS